MSIPRKDISSKINESKLKAFSIGSMNLKKTKKEQEEARRKEEEKATKDALQEFVASFDEDPSKRVNKTWVKGGLVNPDKSEKPIKTGNRLYKPSSKLSESILGKKDDAAAKNERQERINLKPKKQDKRKSNLEIFKEELKVIQKDRDERRQMKISMGIDPGPSRRSRFEPLDPKAADSSNNTEGDYRNFNYDDTMTTNIYLGNINPTMTEQNLCEVFGRYGPLASVKIMWPRSEEERNRGRNCGFVAYMNRKDGERAIAQLQGKEIEGFEMKLGWGKAIAIPPQPMYIPPSMLEASLPPPPSGLPFNAQVKHDRSRRGAPSRMPPDEKTLSNAVVKVVIPTERSLLTIIHRMIEFVVREGPMFEAMIMNRELNNPMFRFLFENQSPAHVYYRWKLFSVLQGDQLYKWRLDEFRMFKGGSLWRPPPMQQFTRGMIADDTRDDSKRGELSDSQRDRLEDMLRDLTAERTKVGDAMVWCMDHAESAQEIVECITESLSILQTPVPKKIARLFLVSDILHNSSAKVPNASFFRKYFEPKLPEIFKDILDTYKNIEGRLKAEQFKQKIMCLFRAWEDWTIYPNDLLIKLQNIFLGLLPVEKDSEKSGKRNDEEGGDGDVDGKPAADTEDVDGAPMDGEDLDGAPLQAMEDSNEMDGEPMAEDVDGVPIDQDNAASLQTEKGQEDTSKKFKFEPSKWESVDESTLQEQAMTTSKWETLEGEEEKTEEEEDLDGMPMEEDSTSMDVSQSSSPAPPQDDQRARLTEERRAKLREIELKVIKYHDELEAGKRTRKSNMTLVEQVHAYREKLTHKEEERFKERLLNANNSPANSSRPSRSNHRSNRSSRHKHRDADISDVSTGGWAGVEGYDDDSNDNYDGVSYADSPYQKGTQSPKSRSPSIAGIGRSPLPSAYRADPSPARRHRSRSRSPRRRHRSRSPRRSKKHRSRSRSRSRSPRHRHKHKKSRH